MLFTEVIQPTENILNNFSVFLFFVPFLNTEKDVSTKTFPKNWDSQRYLLELSWPIQRLRPKSYSFKEYFFSRQRSCLKFQGRFLGSAQRYTYRVLQTILMKLILCVSGQSWPFWAALKVL